MSRVNKNRVTRNHSLAPSVVGAEGLVLKVRARFFWWSTVILLVGCGPGSCAGVPSTPYPTVTPIPTTAPAGVVAPSVTAIALSLAGAQSTFSVTQAAYSGSFTALSSNTAIATVAPGTQPNTFIVTAGTTPGTATITVTGAPGTAAGVVTVVVTITQGTVN